MTVNKKAISFGEQLPKERIITSDKIIIRNNFTRIVPDEEDTTNPAPQLDGYLFTETTYTPAEYIAEIDAQLTDLQVMVADLYEGQDEQNV